MGNFIYAKSGGKPTTEEKLTTTFKMNGKIESVREIIKFLQGFSDSDKLSDIIGLINGKIPAEASASNQLADKAYVNTGFATNSATHRGTYNLVSDLNLTTSATREQISAALATAIATADNNDYCYVQIPTADATPTEIADVDRWKFNGTSWAFEYSLTNVLDVKAAIADVINTMTMDETDGDITVQYDDGQ